MNKFQELFIAEKSRRIHSIFTMNAIATLPSVPFLLRPATQGAKEQFRLKFQRSLRSCVRRGFSVEESFGMIWEETWEEVALSDREQGELYEELIEWAKKEAFLWAY